MLPLTAHDDRQGDDRWSDEGGLPSVTAREAAYIAPFVAWMATQSLDETTRRRFREDVDAYLVWARTDDGPAAARRRRYEDHVGRNAPERLGAAKAALDQYAEYRDLVLRTLPTGNH